MVEKNKTFTYDDSYLKKLDSFFLSVGEADSYRQFAVTTLEQLGRLITYDQAVGLFVDASGKMADCYLVGVEERWAYIYKEYYAKIQANFSLGMKKDRAKKKYSMPVEPITWARLPENEFIKECIGPRGVRHSLDFTLFDNWGQSRLVLALDRTRPIPYSPKDVELINRLIPHLDNMHRKFFISSNPDVKMNRRDALLEMGTLTKREKEVVSCLCDGIPINNICQLMDISRATLYRHMANIYKKLDVNNLQELLVYFLGE